LEQMHALGILDVFVVIGHLGHLISQTLGDGSDYGVRIEYVEQQRRLGLAHALGQLEPHVGRPFLLMLGDIFFEIPEPHRMMDEMEAHGAAAVLAVKEETDPEAVKRNFAVLLREDGSVRRVIEKPRHVTTLLKGCGLYLFDLPIFDAIRRTPRTAMRDEYELTDSIQILIDLDYRVWAAPVVKWDVNITYTGDLIECCQHQLRRLGKTSVVGQGCTLAEGVCLTDTVLGDRVVVRKPVALERCVVLDDVIVDTDQSCRDAVITKHGLLRPGTESEVVGCST
ncbi:MAG: hypothetical protein JXR94_15610, partial [Candidatus Hydrogenedentes bacterium]|nr:hypothetical protein [Candidatus Hydrogenedentota bacterium]